MEYLTFIQSYIKPLQGLFSPRKKSNQYSINRLSNGRDYITKKNDRDVIFHRKKKIVINDGLEMPTSSDDKMTTNLSQDVRPKEFFKFNSRTLHHQNSTKGYYWEAKNKEGQD